MKRQSQYVFSQNPWLIEKERSRAAKNNEVNLFKELYSKKYSSVKNVNTQGFWDSHFTKDQALKYQDDMTREKLNILISFLPSIKSVILDLGFGQGYFEELLFIDRNDELHGIDISLSAVQKAKRRFKGNYKKDDVLKIKKIFSKEKFDVIAAIELIEHISPEKILKFFADIYFLLKPGGLLILSTPTNEHLDQMNNNPSGHVRAYTPAILRMELEICGFKVEEIRTLYAFKKYYRLKKVLAKIFPNHWEPNSLIVKAVKI